MISWPRGLKALTFQLLCCISWKHCDISAKVEDCVVIRPSVIIIIKDECHSNIIVSRLQVMSNFRQRWEACDRDLWPLNLYVYCLLSGGLSGYHMGVGTALDFVALRTVYPSRTELEDRQQNSAVLQLVGNKKLSCRREAARRSVSLKILLSLEVVQDNSKLRHWIGLM